MYKNFNFRLLVIDQIIVEIYINLKKHTKYDII